jgi:signal peptidase II
VLDRAVKLAQDAWLRPGQSLALWRGVFHLTSVRNSGAAFSLLEGQFALFYAAMAVLLVVVSWFWWRERPREVLPVLSTALVLAGASGNLIDRLTRGFVLDLFDVRLINFAVFNVADLGITAGCILFAVWVLFQGGLNSPQLTQQLTGQPTDAAPVSAPASCAASVDQRAASGTEPDQAAPAGRTPPSAPAREPATKSSPHHD